MTDRRFNGVFSRRDATLSFSVCEVVLTTVGEIVRLAVAEVWTDFRVMDRSRQEPSSNAGVPNHPAICCYGG